jgi:hypothetical protein
MHKNIIPKIQKKIKGILPKKDTYFIMVPAPYKNNPRGTPPQKKINN